MSTVCRRTGRSTCWRLDEATGTLSRDWVRSNDLTLSADAVRGVDGALVTENNAATTFPGSTSTTVVRGTTNFWQEGPQTFSVEAWIRTTSTQGGKIVGFGSSNTGRSSSNLTDRHIYMTDTGELRFGLRPDYGTRRTINSPAGYNDGQWHHVVATLGSAGARLYADGELVAQDDTLTKAQVYYGYWRVGGDRLTSWPSAPTREAFEGTIDEVAVYPTALTPAQVEANFSASGRSNEPNTLPVASFTTSDVDGLDVTFDAGDSADPDGTIASYAWDFDDGSAPGAGVAPQHTVPRDRELRRHPDRDRQSGRDRLGDRAGIGGGAAEPAPDCGVHVHRRRPDGERRRIHVVGSRRPDRVLCVGLRR